MPHNLHQPNGRRRGRAFTLVELVLVVMIIGVLVSIAVPRMTTASSKASTNALQAMLANVRKAIDTYYAEHGKYPGYDPSNGAPDHGNFADQLLKYSDERGKTSPVYTSDYRYGPYLRAPFPRNPTNSLDTVHVKPTPVAADPADGSVGWVAVLSHGYFGISATDQQLEDVGADDEIVKEKMREHLAN